MTAVPRMQSLKLYKKRGGPESPQHTLNITMPLPPLANPVPKPEVIKTICVFCGASDPLDPIYFEQANGTYIQ
jgi:hypothetical protein